MVRSQPGVVTKSILTVGDSAAGYRMVGIPDGLGAFDNGDGTFTVLMNHELGATAGAVRDHGAKGAFVSKWTIDKDSLEVAPGRRPDQADRHLEHQRPAPTTPPERASPRPLCSADLPRERLLRPGDGRLPRAASS